MSLVFKNFERSYQTFEGDRLPLIGIYFVDETRFPFPVICKEYKVDVEMFLEGRGKRVFPKDSYRVESECSLLKGLDRNQIQGIRTETGEGISFRDIANVIAEIHRDEFFNKHKWLGRVRV